MSHLFSLMSELWGSVNSLRIKKIFFWWSVCVCVCEKNFKTQTTADKKHIFLKILFYSYNATTFISFIFHWWKHCFVEQTPKRMLSRSLRTCSILRLTVIFPIYPHKLCLLIFNPIPRVALRPCTGWISM